MIEDKEAKLETPSDFYDHKDLQERESKLDELATLLKEGGNNPFNKYICDDDSDDSNDDYQEEKCNADKKEGNEFKSDYVFKRAKQLIVDLCPLSTAVMTNSKLKEKLEKDRLTNSSVENYFKILKHQVLKVALRPIHVALFVDKAFVNVKDICTIRINMYDKNHDEMKNMENEMKYRSLPSTSLNNSTISNSSAESTGSLETFPSPDKTEESWHKKRKVDTDNSKFYRMPPAKNIKVDVKYLIKTNEKK